MAIAFRILRAGDEPVLATLADDVFDDPIDAGAAREFLADPRHHLVVALDDDRVVGFVSAVHYLHPDKPRPEMWINEVGVATTHQGRGVGKGLLQSLLEEARRLNCTEAWVLTSRTNAAAMRLYATVGGQEATEDSVMFTVRLQS